MKEADKTEPKSALNIVLLPDKIVHGEAVLCSTRLSRNFETEFTLDSRLFLPHITLYQGYFPDRNIDVLFEELRKFPVWGEDAEIVMKNFQVSHGTFVFWEAVKSPFITGLHEMIVGSANRLREGNIPFNIQEMMGNLPEEEREMVKKTGGILNLDLFNPHITLTRLKSAKDGKNALDYLRGSQPSKFSPQALYVGKLGDHGTVSEIVEEIFYK